ncbi:MAG: primosomal protein N', partial [Candidatus Obscuribacterales bacterium]|nr:primosomal protein N' [Candidatus Obscuribacterales bacterium]
VALDVNIKDIAERLFTYEIPAHLRSEVFVGSQVLVPFGRQELVSGFVVSIRNKRHIISSASPGRGGNSAELPENTKPISEVLDSNPLFEPKYIEFLYWISEYYLCGISEVLGAAIPAEIGPRVKRLVRLICHDSEQSSISSKQIANLVESPALKSTDDKIKSTLAAAGKGLSIKALKERSALSSQAFYSTLARLRRKGELEVYAEAADTPTPKMINYVLCTGEVAKTKRQEEILSCLKRHNGAVPMQQLIEESKCTSSTIKRMVNEGILSINQVDSFRDPLKGLASPFSPQKPELTDQQTKVLDVLYEAMQQRFNTPVSDKDEASTPWLLHGVTGSGKTEIYLRLIEEAFAQGKSAMLLVPEISLTPQLAQRLLSRFGDQVAIWHSGLSAGERFDTWRRVQSGELRLLLGARSAILSNIPNLGLIILDEEHDGSYKQSTPSPRYSAKRLALERGWREACFVLFGSATPDTSTYFEAKQANRIVELPQRVFQQALPESILVDMRQEFLSGNKSIISLALQEQLAACLERNEQAILLINRRGYASHVFCKACGHVLMCKHCSVSLVFHSKGSY